MNAQGFHKEINVPLNVGQRTIGALVVHMRREFEITMENIKLAWAFAHQVALALELTRLSEEAKQAAIAREQEKAAEQRAADLEKANDALKQSLDSLASEPSLEKFLGQVMRAIAEQFQAPVAEYWSHADGEMAYIEMMTYDGRILNRDEIATLYPDHPGLQGFQVPSEIIHGEALNHRKKYFIIEDWLSHPIVKDVKWMPGKGLYKEINVPMVFGDSTVGALIVRMTREQPITPQKIELAQSLTHQATLALRLTQLADEAKQVAIAREQEKAAEERAAELVKANDALKRSIAHLTNESSLSTFLNAVLHEAIRASGAVSSAVFAYHAETDCLQMIAKVLLGETVDIATDPRLEIWRNPVPANITNAWEALLQRKILWIDNDNPPPEHWPQSITWHREMGHKTIGVLPLTIAEHPLGFLGLCFAETSPASDVRLEQCWTLAQHVSLALQLTQLAGEVKQAAIVEERNRLAQDIHDTLAQSFTGILIQLDAISNSTTRIPTAVQPALQQIQQLAEDGVAEARRSVRSLRPRQLESGNLATALRKLVEKIAAQTNITLNLTVNGDRYLLPPDTAGNLLRIAQEAIYNALKHAQPNVITIDLLYEPETVMLSIDDDGRGFDPQQQLLPTGFGIIGMQERAERIGGQFSLSSGIGSGTTVTVIAENFVQLFP